MTTLSAQKPRLSFWQIWNMSFGFLGIQFGWALQMANMGAIYEYLGAKPDKIPMLFLAAPLTGLIVQPIVGYMSDHTWHSKLGRRRPYFLVGAIISSIALIFMPNSSTLWMAAGLLWIMDTSINVSMEPFRAFITDKLPDDQRTRGFAMQSVFIGLGSIIASALPWMMSHWFNVQNSLVAGTIPATVRYSFYIGSFAFIAAVLYTVFTSTEYPPADIADLQKKKEEKRGIGAGAAEIFHAIANMPKRMRKLALVQFFTWPGLFLMWFYYSPAVARNVFGAVSEQDALYTKGVEFAGLTLSYYNLVTFVFAFFIPFLAAKLGRKYTHMVCLLAGAAGLISVAFIHNPYMLYASMTGVGIAWASILSMPYAMLGGCLPEDKVGIYMGIFNFFIVLPEILASLLFGWIMSHLLNNNRLLAVEIGGCLMIIAAVLTLRIKEEE
ncbi:maltose/moltooligosaccharide transporter [Mucilaginibacter pineti]|uniref:Maltose/moltooligosaccharide transporter n=1 Tax=Mucilaginibacter pineti TaxID=1391627 RepID=A0A1G7BK46_9SPHI|nr:MFS transporter [Mucilaginibacter pineti]SDE27468.1 maltose/moltooligosaccharide transporter [Mucilaginibacter pineti]